MKNLLLLGTLALMTSNAFAITASGTLALSSSVPEDELKETLGPLGVLSTSAGLTALVSPIAGLVVFADNGVAQLGLDNEEIREEIIDEIEAIQVAIEEETPLSDFQKSVLITGVNAGQLDAYGNILKQTSNNDIKWR